MLVRYIIQDDLSQSKKATNLIESLTSDAPAFISTIVLVELNWVLKRNYKVSKNDRIKTLENLITLSVFEIEEFELCFRSLKLFKQGKADFSDYLIKTSAENAGFKTVITFDKDALAEDGFKSP